MNLYRHFQLMIYLLLFQRRACIKVTVVKIVAEALHDDGSISSSPVCTSGLISGPSHSHNNSLGVERLHHKGVIRRIIGKGYASSPKAPPPPFLQNGIVGWGYCGYSPSRTGRNKGIFTFRSCSNLDFEGERT
ncbi:hypothetical protein BDZ94DRAFT_1245441 [Collybia nuda]|uniref:Uncharacterized protein n=1 Tax=Collybia nuda TaxID=64659 RepID=A0A9P6CJ79_9AGAR|nr:hypothetical protein BDZ94DRAFT_1245441 [Collybia nuda]